MRDEQIVSEIAGVGLFRLLKTNKRTCSFLREGDEQAKHEADGSRVGLDRACET